MAAPFAGVPFVLDGPAPVAPPFRLLDVATVLDIPDPHWANGAQLWGYPEGCPEGHDPCAAGTFRDKAEAGNVPIPEYGPFTAYVPISCTPRSLHDEGELLTRVTAVFNATESAAVERQLLSGAYLPLNPYIADDNVAILGGGTAQSADVALGLLEDAIGETCRAGVIHMTPFALTLVAGGFNSVQQTGNRLFTRRGTPIIVGDGYIGGFPDSVGTSADDPWMWATGPVIIARSGVITNPQNMRQALDRASNLITFYAERDYLVGWDTALQAAVKLDAGGMNPGGGGE